METSNTGFITEGSIDTLTPNKKRWSGWKSAVIVLSLTSLCAIGLFVASIFWKQESETKLNDKILSLQTNQGTSETEECPEVIEERPVEDLPETIPEDNARYLAIKEWGMKLKIPDEFSELSYGIGASASNNMANTAVWLYGKFQLAPTPITISNSNLENKVLVIPQNRDRTLGLLLRFPENNDPQKTCMISCADFAFNNGGYNFYYQYPQSSITTDSSFDSLEWLATYMTGRMLVTAEFI